MIFAWISQVDIDKDISQANAGEQNLLLKSLSGLNDDASKARTVVFDIPSLETHQDSDPGESEEDESGSEGESDDGDESKFVNSARPRDESPESKKVRLLCYLV